MYKIKKTAINVAYCVKIIAKLVQNLSSYF